MIRLTKKIRLFSLLSQPTTTPHFLALSSDLLRFFKSLASKTLTLFTMEDLFANDDDDFFWDLDYRSHSLPQRRFPEEEQEQQDPDFGNETLYLVPHRWWKDAQVYVDQVEGVLYTVHSIDEDESEVVLHLRKEDDFGKSENGEVGFTGGQYALVPEGIWLLALKRHNDSSISMKEVGNIFETEDYILDVFPLKLRICVLQETNLVVAKINQKDNLFDFYKNARDIFGSKQNPLLISDFSGQTTQIFINDRADLSSSSPSQPSKEILLALQIHGLPDYMEDRDETNNKLNANESRLQVSYNRGSLATNGCIDDVITHGTLARSSPSSICRGSSFLGFAGLHNLGNTCFMNSAVQCLVHTPKLVDYFLGDYKKDINLENLLGMNGKLALAFGDLFRKLWAPGARPVAPRMFKMKIADFAPQFSGYNQHDSQELLAFLLDGLHEDLNRVKCKPYFEIKDAGRSDEEVAKEYWQNHLARNDSIIVDLFQGQFKSTLVCPVCKKLSVTFDPFMYLSLPLPSTNIRSMTLKVFSTDGITLPSKFTLTVPKHGMLKDLIEALTVACSLRGDESLLLAEVYKNHIFRLLEEPSDLLALIRDEDTLVAYRLPKNDEASPLVVFNHQHVNRNTFGVPLVSRLAKLSHGYDLHRQFLKLINPFVLPDEDCQDGDDNIADDVDGILNEDIEMDDATSTAALGSGSEADGERGSDSHTEADFTFFLSSSSIGKMDGEMINMNEPLALSEIPKKLEVVVLWSDKMIEKYDTCLLSSLPQVSKPCMFNYRPEESVSLYKCLEAFLKEEPLGPEDKWYCPSCKKPHQATKKLDLWRLPEILVIHLKRFSYSRYFKNKLETFVDFPINDLDFSGYTAQKKNQVSRSGCYILYAISCHYGGLGGGHYTAFVRHFHDKWYEFDDNRVTPVHEEMIKTSAAYVLFYRRVQDLFSDATT